MHPVKEESATAEQRALLDRYLVSLDDDRLDEAWAAALFTEDATVEFPMSRHVGRVGLAAYHRNALAAFASTQHLGSPVVVDGSADAEPTLRANLISTHVHHAGAADEPLFQVGTLATAKVRTTEAGWRLSALSFRVLWSRGTPPRSGERS